LQITLPEEGIYGIVDHYVENQKDVSGFRKIKLKIQNMTTDSAGNIVRTSPAGKLVAVAKFHRNKCYTSDLAGEYGAPVSAVMPGRQQCRDAEEDVVASTPIAVPSEMDVSPQQVTFTFTSPIPINATDLYLQVVYRGPAGDLSNPDEADNIFVGTKDVSEPHFAYTFGKHWDQFTYYAYWPIIGTGSLSYTQWCTGGSSPAFPSVEACSEAEGNTFKVQYSPTTAPIPGYDMSSTTLAPAQTYDISQEPPFNPVAVMTAPVGSFARIAVLTDAQPTNTVMWVREHIDATHNNRIFEWNSGSVLTTTNQLDLSDKTLQTYTQSAIYVPARGIYVHDSDADALNAGDANPIPPLKMVPSTINF
jgi:hypothetical protein